MGCVFVSIICCFITSKSTSRWTTTNVPNLPRADHSMACAAINDSIFIFGGYTFKTQLSEYIVSENRMVDHGENVLSEITHGFGQYYTQFEHILYITAHIDGLSIHHFSIYDLSTNNFLSTVSFTTIFPSYIERGVGCCVAASDKYIFITGGYAIYASVYTDSLQIFELNLNKWYNGTSMQNTRVDHACIVVYDFLYVIGGIKRSSIEKINISTSTFAMQSWQYIQPLTSYVTWAECLWYNDKIWIIGGVNRDWSTYIEPLNTVHVIDVYDDSVTLRSERLSYTVYRACGISLNHTLYVFGGNTDANTSSKLLSTGMRYGLDITSAPTNDPIYDPSHVPSNAPSHDPSNAPSFVPSADPSYTTSNTPSFDLSSDPFYNTDAINSTHFMDIFTSLNATNNDMNSVTEKNQINMQYILIALIISVVIMIACICWLCVVLYIRSALQQKNLSEYQAEKQPSIAQDKSNEDVKLAELKKPNQAMMRSVVSTKQLKGNKDMIKDGDTELEHSNESSDGLWNIEATNDGPVTENETEGDPSQHCTDCGLQKAGKVYEGDQLFYCHDCFISYSDVYDASVDLQSKRVEMIESQQQHATTNRTITSGAGQEGK